MRAFAFLAVFVLLDPSVTASPIKYIDTVWTTTTKTYYTTIDWYVTVAADSIVPASIPAPTSILTQAPIPAPAPAPSSTTIITTQAPVPVPVPAPAPAPAPTSSSSQVLASVWTSSSTQIAASIPTAAPPSSAGSSFSGDLTFYTPGLGSCGVTSTSSDSIVALSTDYMQNGANPNANPLCGRTITISYGGVEKQATVVDTCVGCSMYSIDLSPSLFDEFAAASVGRLYNAEWWFSS